MTDDPTLPVLRALQHIQSTGSVSRAAAALGVTQSAISRSISKYEKAIGLQLMRRDTRPLKLTREGELVAAHGAEIDRSLEAMNERLKFLKQGKDGVVRIGSFGPSASTQILPALITRFTSHYPGISVSVLEGPDEVIRDDLLSGNVDVAVLVDPVDGFDAIPVASNHLVALVREGSELSSKSTLVPADLVDEPFVMPLAGSEAAIREWFANAGTVPNVKHRIQQTNSILAFVRADMGAAIVTSLSLPENLSGVSVIPLQAMPQREIYLAKTSGTADSKAVSIFWGFLDRTIAPGVDPRP